MGAARANIHGGGDGGEDGQHFVFVLSDDNLRRYGIDAGVLGTILTSDPGVSAHFIAIASMADEANRIANAMPPG